MGKIKTAIEMAVEYAKETETIHPEAVHVVNRIIIGCDEDDMIQAICNRYLLYKHRSNLIRNTKIGEYKRCHTIHDSILEILKVAVKRIDDDVKR